MKLVSVSWLVHSEPAMPQPDSTREETKSIL
jgi:hypothetical protein